MKVIFFVFLIFNQLFFASGAAAKINTKVPCSVKFGKAGLCASINPTTPISRKSEVKFHLSFYEDKAKTKVLKLLKLPEVKLWMVMKSGHGHGSEELKITSTKDGFEISNAWFLMVGDWQVKIKFDYNGQEYAADANICVERKAKDSFVGRCKQDCIVKKYLVAVDDEEDLKFLFEHFFEDVIEDGLLEVIFLHTGQDCLDKMKELDGEVIVLSDINMPKMNGIELLRRLSQTYPEIRVLLVSAYDESKFSDAMSQWGAEGYITKPIDFNELRNRVFSMFNLEVTSSI